MTNKSPIFKENIKKQNVTKLVLNRKEIALISVIDMPYIKKITVYKIRSF